MVDLHLSTAAVPKVLHTIHPYSAPLIQHQLCRFVSCLANESLSHFTIKGYLAALHHLQISRSLPDPAISAIPKLGVVKGIKVTQARVELPLTLISVF